MSKMDYTILLRVFVSLEFFTQTFSQQNSGSHCVPVPRGSICEDLPYNQTVFPNVIGHQDLEQAHEALDQFVPLIYCSPYMKQFLCALHIAPCTILSLAIAPCRSMCEHAVTKKCKDTIQRYEQSEQKIFQCDKYPLDGLCTPFKTDDIDKGSDVTIPIAPPADEFHCFKRYRNRKQTCGGLLRRKVSGPESCCSGQGQGFTRRFLDQLGRNVYTCESCKDWKDSLTPTEAPKEDFRCFRKYRPNMLNCGGPVKKSRAQTIEECCLSAGNGYDLYGKNSLGKNKYTCESCEEWLKTRVTTEPPVTTEETVTWSDWSRCSVTCGRGHQTRYRQCSTCDPTLPSNQQTKVCMVTQYCEEHGNWGSWSSWGECTQSCNGGTMQRSRECDSPPPRHGGKECEGDDMETGTCNEQPCPVHGSWSRWSYFGPCSESCGRGEMTRTRLCNDPAPLHSGRSCHGQDKETRHCEARKCPQHGGWSDWAQWSDCSGTCGRGERVRTRRCDRPTPRFGGRNCDGSADEIEVCDNNRECPVDGGWSEWGSYGTCRANPCERGYRLRVRECDNPRPRHRGRMCVGRSVERTPCMNSDGCPVDGEWCGFELWSSCSSSCVGKTGVQTRYRTCYCPPPQNGGKSCQGSPYETQECEGYQICDNSVVEIDTQR